MRIAIARMDFVHWQHLNIASYIFPVKYYRTPKEMLNASLTLLTCCYLLCSVQQKELDKWPMSFG